MKQKVLFSVRDICEIALLSSLAIVLGFFCEIKIGQNGGSIGFSMIPLIFICFRHGLIKGFISCGLIYGFASSLYDGYGLAYYLFDYLLAYGVLSIVSLFYKKVFTEQVTLRSYIYLNASILIATFLRYTMHVLSGVIMWKTSFIFSLEYNILYMLPSSILCMIVFSLLLKPMLNINKLFPVVKRF
jgi:thiamine transporter